MAETKSKAPLIIGLSILGVGGVLLYRQLSKAPVSIPGGSRMALTFKWKNISFVPLVADFRFDIHQEGTTFPATWQEGGWLPGTEAVDPNTESSVITIDTVPIPGNWGGSTFGVKLVARVADMGIQTDAWVKDKAGVVS